MFNWEAKWLISLTVFENVENTFAKVGGPWLLFSLFDELLSFELLLFMLLLLFEFNPNNERIPPPIELIDELSYYFLIN